jgi:hypothetical protein
MALTLWHRSLWISLALANSVCCAQTAFPARELTIKGVYGERRAEPEIYCLLGGGACQPPEDTGAADSFIRNWMAAHPNAVATPISTETRSYFLPDSPMRREIYVWIQDGQDSLSTTLVREGFYPASIFEDMLERDRKFYDAAERILGTIKQKSANGHPGPPHGDPPRRLVADGEYTDFMQAAAAAEFQAKGAGKRIWSEDSRLGEASLSLAAAMSRQSFSVREMYASGVHAHRFADADVYCLLRDQACATGWPIPPLVPEEYRFVAHWLRRHPDAVATPISVQSQKRMQNGPRTHSTYVWVEDGGQSLNVELVRGGYYRADSLRDVIAEDGRVTAGRQNDDPAKATEFPELDSESDEPGPPVRLVSERSDSLRMDRVKTAEAEAQKYKRGLWSDAEMARWNPPSDAKLIEKYGKHKKWFARIVDLTGTDQRLPGVNWDPESWNAPLKGGTPNARIQEYVRLLKKLDVNRDLTGVMGIGKVCLITTDIVYGLVDTGVIKGYVWSPTDPNPLAEDLEHQTPASAQTGTSAPITYRHIDSQWYLFELVH